MLFDSEARSEKARAREEEGGCQPGVKLISGVREAWTLTRRNHTRGFWLLDFFFYAGLTDDGEGCRRAADHDLCCLNKPVDQAGQSTST
jgi:hypothetical protein